MISLARLDVPTVRAALWTRVALLRARRRLKGTPLERNFLQPPPLLPPGAERGVWAILRRSPNTCLERAVILQAWRAGQGDSRDVVIGVRGRGAVFEAHAWLDGEADVLANDFFEIARVPPA